ncbi:hypothetical protein [Streptomyces sp. NPDC059970]|uniref:hypothetical protein n=1 Tax=Streptomyces sp. NPDC059970 TaxID=3347019 RepID=UPI00369034E4
MEQSRVVGVNGPGGKPGSGYAVAAHLVLTSAHVCPEPGNQVTVFQHGRPPCTARVVWRGTPEGRDDAALVLVDDPSWIPPCSSSGTRWGRLASSTPGTPCETWGLPNMVQQKGRPNDYLHPVGTLNFGDRSIGNRYVMNVDGHPPAPRADGASPWGASRVALCSVPIC